MQHTRSSLMFVALLAAPLTPATPQVSVSLPSVSLPTVGPVGGGSIGGGTISIGGPGAPVSVGGTTGGPLGTVGSTLDSLGSPVGGVTSSVGNTVGTIGGGINNVLGTLNTTRTQIVGGRLTTSAGAGAGAGPGVTMVRLTQNDVREAIQPSLSRYVHEVWEKDLPPETRLKLRQLRLAELVRTSGGRLEMDHLGNPTVRGRVIVIDPTKAGLTAARRAGFVVASDERDAILGLRFVTFTAPRGMATANALVVMRRVAPRSAVDLDHIFEPAGGSLAASTVALAASASASPTGRRPLVGMIDGGVGEAPSLAGVTIVQRGFAGEGQATGHGTAIASLIAGSHGKFRGAAPGVSLIVGDVFDGDPAKGSATAMVRALSWIAAQRPAAVNISLVGPRNALVERAVAATLARNIKVVAAVGNDGPAAPPLYPSSQAGVIAVTGVDGGNRALIEAGRSLHLDYGAPGADLAAALPGKGYTIVRGTSFAAPFVTARLALTGSTARLDAEVAKGWGRVGRGVICKSCRVHPRHVRAR